MNINGKIVQELVKYTRELQKGYRELRKANQEQRKMTTELRQANLRQEKMKIIFEKRLQMEYVLSVKQSKEVEILKEWLKNHEVRLRGLGA